MQKFSLNKNLIVAVVLSQLLLAAGLVIVGASFSLYYIRSAFDVYLRGRARSVAALVYYRDDGIPGLLFNATKVPESPHVIHKDFYLVKSDRGNFEWHAPGFDPHIFDAIPANARYWDFRHGGRMYRAIILRRVVILDTEPGEPLPLPTLTVIYAAPTMDIEHEITALAVSMGTTGILVLIPTLLLALWSLRRALKPLTELASAAGAISVDSWKFEPSEEAKSTEELRPLIGAIQTVLAELEAAFKRQRDFMGDAAHELKTSLAVLKSTLQSLLNRPREREDYRRGLVMMSEDCERLERLLNRMLQTARAEQRIAKGHQTEIDPVDVASTCEQAIARLAQFAAEREIGIEFTTSGEALVRAEAGDLELVWLNLLENAVQYSPRGSTVSMKVEAEDGRVTVSVSDQGCGIDKVHLPHIFERFYRADSSRARATGGVGLGLAIAKSLVDFYQGTISVESELGSGTRMQVELPTVTQEVGRQGKPIPVLQADL
ncbi:MAG TPA: HAMP domain-containing sensor histidine kinase [Terracidiphilus sp.]|nr:HAMP domain-containing sensor histidine kinase [Terracidiphilus sp.]